MPYFLPSFFFLFRLFCILPRSCCPAKSPVLVSIQVFASLCVCLCCFFSSLLPLPAISTHNTRGNGSPSQTFFYSHTQTHLHTDRPSFFFASSSLHCVEMVEIGNRKTECKILFSFLGGSLSLFLLAPALCASLLACLFEGAAAIYIHTASIEHTTHTQNRTPFPCSLSLACLSFLVS